MEVLKIVAEGIVTSFRYPHFALSVQPSFTMPPPATIYGHICSAVGDWIDPHGLQFAYHFTHAGEAEDLEHVHVLSASSGKLPQTNYPKVLEGNVNPFQRKILFQPRLTLYLNRIDLLPAFQSPHYALVLGRSQDLFSYRSIKTITLEPRDQIYLEHTLLPFEMATRIPSGLVTLMPRMLDYYNDRQPIWERYVTLNRRIYSNHTHFLQFEQDRYLADPEEVTANGFARGLIFHSFVGV